MTFSLFHGRSTRPMSCVALSSPWSRARTCHIFTEILELLVPNMPRSRLPRLLLPPPLPRRAEKPRRIWKLGWRKFLHRYSTWELKSKRALSHRILDIALCDVIQGLEADLLVVKALPDARGGTLPLHVDWLYQIIPTRLLVAKESGSKPKVEQNEELFYSDSR